MGRQIIMLLGQQDILALEQRVKKMPVVVLLGGPRTQPPVRGRLSESWSSLVCLESDLESLQVQQHGEFFSISASDQPVVEVMLHDHLTDPTNRQRHSRLWYTKERWVGDQRQPKSEAFVKMAEGLVRDVRRWANPVKWGGRNAYVGPHLLDEVPDLLLPR